MKKEIRKFENKVRKWKALAKRIEMECKLQCEKKDFVRRYLGGEGGNVFKIELTSSTTISISEVSK